MKKYYELLSKRLLLITMLYMLIFSVIAYSAALIHIKGNFERSENKKAEQFVINLKNSIAQCNSFSTSMARNSRIALYAQENGTYNIDNINQTDKLFEIYQGFTDVASYSVLNPYNNHLITEIGSNSIDMYCQLQNIPYQEFLDKVKKLASINENSIEFMQTETQNTNNIIIFISRATNFDKPAVFSFLYDADLFFKGISAGNVPTTFYSEIKQSDFSFAYSLSEKKFLPPDSLKGFKKNITNYENYSNFSGVIHCSVYAGYFDYLLHINNFFLLILLFVAAFLVLSFFIVKTNTNFLYSPVKKALSLLPDNITDNNGEFGAFEKYITSLSSQRDVMAEIISDNKVELEDKFLLKVLTSTASPIELKSGIATYGLKNVKFPCLTFIVTYRNYDDLKELISNEGLNEIRRSIHEYFYDIFKDYEFFKLIDIDQKNIAGIISASSAESFISQMKTAALGIEMLMDIALAVFVGTKADSWHDICDSYSEAIKTKEQYWIVPNQNIVIQSDKADKSTNRIIYFSPSLEEDIISSVMSANKELAINKLNQIIDSNMEGKALTRDYYSQLVIMLYSTFTKILTAINKTEKELFISESIYLELMSCQDAEVLKLKTGEFITTIISSIARDRKIENENEKDVILSYIHNNYKNDISLFSLADYLNISQIYASKKFKQCIGESFKDYITNYRLDMAVEKLNKNPKENLSTIAKSVGFSSRTFTRAFTQKYNMTPSDYVQKLK